MKLPTVTQKQVLEFIRKYMKENGFSPSVIDIADNFEIHPNGAQMHLNAMEKKGMITRVPKKARTIQIVEGK